MHVMNGYYNERFFVSKFRAHFSKLAAVKRQPLVAASIPERSS